MQHGIFIGPSKDTVEAARNAVIDIIQSGVSDAVMEAALDTIRDICTVRNTSISGCTFTTVADVKEDDNDE